MRAPAPPGENNRLDLLWLDLAQTVARAQRLIAQDEHGPRDQSGGSETLRPNRGRPGAATLDYEGV